MRSSPSRARRAALASTALAALVSCSTSETGALDPTGLDRSLSLAFEAQPVDQEAGRLQAVRVGVHNARGELVVSRSVDVTLVLRPSSGGADLAAGFDRTEDGVAIFGGTDLAVTGRFRLVASSDDAAQAISDELEVAPVPGMLAFAVGPRDTIARTELSPPVVVSVLALDGTELAREGIEVSLSMIENGLPSTEPPLTATTLAGRATFDAVSFPRPGRFRLHAEAPGLLAATSDEVIAGEELARVRFLVEPPSAVAAGDRFLISMELVDGMDNRIADNRVVTVSLAGATRALGGMLAKQTVRGLVTFDDLSYPVEELVLLSITAPNLAPSRQYPVRVLGPRVVTRMLGPGGLQPIYAAMPSLSADGSKLAYAVLGYLDLDGNEVLDGAGVRLRELATGTEELINVSDDEVPGNNWDSGPYVSGNGAFVVWTSGSTNFIPHDENGYIGDAYLRDLGAGTTSMLGFDASAQQCMVGSFFAGAPISDDGSRAVYVAQELQGPGATEYTLYYRDLAARVSTTVAAGAGLYHASISGDGRFITFQTEEALAGDTDAHADVYLYGVESGRTDRITKAPGGGGADGPSEAPFSSADGRFIAFGSSAGNLGVADTNGAADVFVYDRSTGLIELVSLSSTGGRGGARPSSTPEQELSRAGGISADGRYVVFVSTLTGLVRGDNDLNADAFVHDRATGVTERVSVGFAGAQADGNTLEVTISGDGRTIAFASDATNLAPQDTNARSDVFVTPNPLAP